jgi:phosphatidate phosphatase APP1
MQSSFLFSVHNAAVALPAHLHNSPVLYKNWDGALSAGYFTHAPERRGVSFDIILHEL